MKQDISYLLNQRKHNDLTSEKHKRLRRGLSYFERVLILFLLSVDMFQFLCFSYLVSVRVRIVSSVVELKLYMLTARIKNSQSSGKKKKVQQYGVDSKN